MTGSFSDPAIGNDGFGPGDSCSFIESLELVKGLEGPIFIARLGPGDAAGARDVSPSLTRLRQTGWGEHLTRKLLRAADINQLHGFFLGRLLHVQQVGTNREIGVAGRVGLDGHIGGIGTEFSTFLQPFGPSAIHDAYILVPVNLELPESPGGKPVVIVAVKNHLGAVADSRLTQKFFEIFLGGDVALVGVAQLGIPGPTNGPRDMAFIIGLGVHVDFDDSDIGIVLVLLDPLRRNQHFRMFVISHMVLLLKLFFFRYGSFIIPIAHTGQKGTS